MFVMVLLFGLPARDFRSVSAPTTGRDHECVCTPGCHQSRNKHKMIPWSFSNVFKSHECCRQTSAWFLKDYQMSTRFFSRLMLRKRRRFWRPARLLIRLEDTSRTWRPLRFSNPSITFSRFPLSMQRGKRTYLNGQGHDTHEYAWTHEESCFIHRRWFLLINIKGAVVALWGARTPSPQCWVDWQACFYLLNPDRWGLAAQQMLRR